MRKYQLVLEDVLGTLSALLLAVFFSGASVPMASDGRLYYVASAVILIAVGYVCAMLFMVFSHIMYQRYVRKNPAYII